MCDFKAQYSDDKCVKHVWGMHVLASGREFPIENENPIGIGIDPAIGSMDMPVRTTWQAGKNLGIGFGVN